MAQCIPGLPCVIGKTANPTPFDPSDGPNAGSAPNAQKTDSAACDADFMNQIYAKSFVEAQREIMMNQTIIRKPDSVLEYTCFDQILRDTAEIAGPIFSESPRFTGATVTNPDADDIEYTANLGDTNLDTALDTLVVASLNSYVGSNFSHDFIGGTAGINNSIAANVAGAQTTCGMMEDIFFLARCNDFGLDDMFQKLDYFIANDPRQLPAACNGGTQITQELLDVANNKNFAYVNFDQTKTFLEFANATPCAPPIQTGITTFQVRLNVDLMGNVNRVVDDSYPDAVCANPGCYFDAGSGTCKTN